MNQFNPESVINTVFELPSNNNILKETSYISFTDTQLKVVFWFDQYNIYNIHFEEIKNCSNSTSLYGSVFVLCSGDINQQTTITDKYLISSGGLEIESMKIIEYNDKNGKKQHAPEYASIRIYFGFSSDLMLIFNLLEDTKKKLFLLNIISELRKKQRIQDFEKSSLYIRLLHSVFHSFINYLNITKEHDSYLDIICQS